MNFERIRRLNQLLDENKLEKAIEAIEDELKKIPETVFHEILGKDILHHVADVVKFIGDFHLSTQKVLRSKVGLLKLLFGNKSSLSPAAYYCEMNGFTINYDRWFIDLFAFKKFNTIDWDWLSDFYDSTAQDLTITGFEELQEAFQDVHEKDRFDEPNIDESYELCELLVILRLQELFKKVYSEQRGEWASTPMFVTAHDYDLIYRAV